MLTLTPIVRATVDCQHCGFRAVAERTMCPRVPASVAAEAGPARRLPGCDVATVSGHRLGSAADLIQ